jgi:hypothetical protein
MFIAKPTDNGSLRQERHAKCVCTLRSYGAPVCHVAKAINMLLLRSKAGEPSMLCRGHGLRQLGMQLSVLNSLGLGLSN